MFKNMLLVQFALMVLGTILLAVMLVGQIVLADGLAWYHAAVGLLLILALIGCKVTWKEYKNEE